MVSNTSCVPANMPVVLKDTPVGTPSKRTLSDCSPSLLGFKLSPFSRYKHVGGLVRAVTSICMKGFQFMYHIYVITITRQTICHEQDPGLSGRGQRPWWGSNLVNFHVISISMVVVAQAVTSPVHLNTFSSRSQLAFNGHSTYIPVRAVTCLSITFTSLG